MTGIKEKCGHTDIHTGKTPGEHEGRDLGDDSTSPGTPKMASNPPDTQREAWIRLSLTASEGAN